MVYVSFSLCNNQFRTRYCEIVIQIGARPPPWFPVYSRNHNDLSSSCPCWLAWWHDPSPANLRGLSLLLTMFFSGWVHCICLFKFKIGQKDTKRPNEDYLDSTHTVPAPPVMAATYRNFSSPNVPGQLPLPSRIPPPPPDFLVFSLLCPRTTGQDIHHCLWAYICSRHIHCPFHWYLSNSQPVTVFTIERPLCARSCVPSAIRAPHCQPGDEWSAPKSHCIDGLLDPLVTPVITGCISGSRHCMEFERQIVY